MFVPKNLMSVYTLQVLQDATATAVLFMPAIQIQEDTLSTTLLGIMRCAHPKSASLTESFSRQERILPHISLAERDGI